MKAGLLFLRRDNLCTVFRNIYYLFENAIVSFMFEAERRDIYYWRKEQRRRASDREARDPLMTFEFLITKYEAKFRFEKSCKIRCRYYTISLTLTI